MGSPTASRIAISFNRPTHVASEFEYIQTAIRNGHLRGDGPFTAKCQDLLESELGIQKALLTTSCTSALEMAALLLDIHPGDEVIIPSFTFVATANAFALRGATPVFADIRPDTLNLDEQRLEERITKNTKAIVVMHYAGVGCEMDEIMAIARRRSIPVVEDNAHGLFGKYKNQYLGSLGCLATQSFHETKNFTCGEGGALLINDSRLTSKAEIIREHGTNRARFIRGQVDKYTWINLGSSYLPADILAALLWAQLEARPLIQGRREHIWNFYYSNLRQWADQNDIQLPTLPTQSQHPSHLFYMIMKTPQERDGMIAHLRHAGIQSAFHYPPLHLSGMGRSFGGKEGDCPVTEAISERLLRLPLHAELDDAALNRVAEQVQSFFLRSKPPFASKSESGIEEPSL